MRGEGRTLGNALWNDNGSATVYTSWHDVHSLHNGTMNNRSLVLVMVLPSTHSGLALHGKEFCELVKLQIL